MKCRGWIIAGLLASQMSMTVPGETPPASHADSFSKEGLFKADVSTLKDTQLVAHLDVPLRENQNVLWCGTLQLTWNKTIDLVGEKLHFANQPPVVDLLNQEDFTDADLDPPSYVALADFERNNVEDEIRAALEKTFHGAASPELIPPRPAHFGPDDFVAYAYLYKNLSFPQPFEDNPPIDFGKSQVKAFGFMTNLNRLPDGMIEQVAIYDYKSRDNFIIKLKTKSPDDELILAKINPVSTLQATLDNVLRRMAKNTPMTPVTGDTLAVPKFNFDLRGDFPALEGLILEPSPIAHVKKLKMESVRQLVRFQLNEKGAILKSEAEITMRATMVFVRPEPHVMVFDKPFLILMKRTNSEHPYFALWVGNASLLVGTTPK